ncbi:phosphogluconate dehydrogenase (NAD(+)-dependent, decarboxylating) [Candidatus Mycoplasma pogonae]
MKLKKIAVIGLGKMGSGFALNAKQHHYQVAGYDVIATQNPELNQNIELTNSLAELVSWNGKTGVYLLSIPHGKPTKDTITALLPLLDKGAIILDMGNNNWKATKENAQLCAEYGVELIDAGTSGGPSGARNGACFMVGGSNEAVAKVEQLFLDLAQPEGYLHVGAVGAGHFSKMIHNGIEYGMMQAIAEGFAVLESSEFNYDLNKLAKLWNSGSVIRSWLIELTANVFAKQNLEAFTQTSGVVDATGEAKWSLETALELDVPTPVIALSLMMRQQSKLNDPFANKLLAQLRQQFGGHAVQTKTKK